MATTVHLDSDTLAILQRHGAHSSRGRGGSGYSSFARTLLQRYELIIGAQSNAVEAQFSSDELDFFVEVLPIPGTRADRDQAILLHALVPYLLSLADISATVRRFEVDLDAISAKLKEFGVEERAVLLSLVEMRRSRAESAAAVPQSDTEPDGS